MMHKFIVLHDKAPPGSWYVDAVPLTVFLCCSCCCCVQMQNLHVLLPASSEAKKGRSPGVLYSMDPASIEKIHAFPAAGSESEAGTVKYAMKSEAVLLRVRELQLCLPGSFRHLAEEVGGGLGIMQGLGLCVINTHCVDKQLLAHGKGGLGCGLEYCYCYLRNPKINYVHTAASCSRQRRLVVAPELCVRSVYFYIKHSV